MCTLSFLIHAIRPSILRNLKLVALPLAKPNTEFIGSTKSSPPTETLNLDRKERLLTAAP